MIAIRYKCACMAEEATVQVRERQEGTDIVDWVEGVMGLALAADHKRRSPDCRRPRTEYVKIPAPENAPFIGGSPKLDS